MLRKIIDKFRIIKKVLKGEKGYTLVEVAAVVAITSTLAAVVIPVVIDKIEQGRLSAAKQDVGSLAGIVQSIFNDTGDYPTRETFEIDDVFTVLFTTDPNDLLIEERGGPFKQNVKDVFTLTSPVDDLSGKLAGDNVYLVENDSDLFSLHAITNGPPGVTPPRYEANEWAGPYMAEDKLDPWGNSYVIYVEPLQEQYRVDLKMGSVGPDKVGGPYRYAWVLSGGPNQVIETTLMDTSIRGDDIGTKIK